MAAQVLSVGLLTAYIRELLEQDELLADLWVEGEISDLFQSRAGHIYFTLKDEESQLRCVMFKGLATHQRHAFRPGDQIAAHGHMSVYSRDGQYQLYADAVQAAGIGLAALQLELLRQQLEAEGLFDVSRKRPIPTAPRYIGVVTSPDGAVWHDIQHVLRRRYPFVELILAPAAVQGDTAPPSIVEALEALQVDGRAEVIIVARGGGSAEDLWCFNDERVARAVFACRVPVVTGVGHETDWTLVDDVADLRAPTPSAAAEVCSPSIVEYMDRLLDARPRLQMAGDATIRARRADVRRMASLVARSAPRRDIEVHQTSLTALRRGLRVGMNHRLVPIHEAVRDQGQRASRYQSLTAQGRRSSVTVATARLGALDPRAVLNRGYAIVVDDHGRLVHSSADLAAGDELEARVRDGTIWSSVIRVTPPSDEPRMP